MVLILDQNLQAFPWESLPCLEGQSVSRLPSLECLRERLLFQRRKRATTAATTTTTKTCGGGDCKRRRPYAAVGRNNDGVGGGDDDDDDEDGDNGIDYNSRSAAVRVVSGASGTYVLNPSGDLKATQDAFEADLKR
jgi:hypothetical protein